MGQGAWNKDRKVMDLKRLSDSYVDYIISELNLSQATVLIYGREISMFISYLGDQKIAPSSISTSDIEDFTVPVTLDREGVIFEMGEGVTDYDLPVISGLTFQNLKLGTKLPGMFIPYLSRLSAVKQSSDTLFEQISEIKFVEKTEGSFDVVIYPANSSIRIRTSSDIDDSLLQQMFTVLDVMEENGIDKQTDELDFRGGKIVYKVKEG